MGIGVMANWILSFPDFVVVLCTRMHIDVDGPAHREGSAAAKGQWKVTIHVDHHDVISKTTRE